MRKIVVRAIALALLGALASTTLHAQSKEAPKPETAKADTFKPEQQQTQGSAAEKSAPASPQAQAQLPATEKPAASPTPSPSKTSLGRPLPGGPVPPACGDVLAAMSTRDKLAQLLMVGVTGADDARAVVDLVGLLDLRLGDSVQFHVAGPANAFQVHAPDETGPDQCSLNCSHGELNLAKRLL